MQRRGDPVGYHAGSIPRGCASGDASVEDQLHVVGTPQKIIVDRFERSE